MIDDIKAEPRWLGGKFLKEIENKLCSVTAAESKDEVDCYQSELKGKG